MYEKLCANRPTSRNLNFALSNSNKECYLKVRGTYYEYQSSQWLRPPGVPFVLLYYSHMILSLKKVG